MVLSGGVAPLSKGAPKSNGGRKVAASSRCPSLFHRVPAY
jgi:hypothetical protein